MGQSTDIERIWDMVDDIPIAMLITRDEGHIRARPMGAYPRRKEHAIYFLTDARRHKDEEIAANPQVCVTFNKGQSYASISGQASVTNDRATIRELFNTPAKAWWDSAEDANIRLLKLVPEEAEYWDAPGKFVSYAKMAAAAATGTRPELGDNAKVNM